MKYQVLYRKPNQARKSTMTFQNEAAVHFDPVINLAAPPQQGGAIVECPKVAFCDVLGGEHCYSNSVKNLLS